MKGNKNRGASIAVPLAAEFVVLLLLYLILGAIVPCYMIVGKVLQ